MKKDIIKKDKLLIYSQFLSALLFAIILIPKLILAIEPQEVKTYVEVEQPVTLSILPVKGTYSVGDTISIQATVHVGNQPINAVSFELLFPNNMVEIVEIDTEGSICTLFPEKNIDNSAGVVKYSCGLPNPGYSDPYGLVGTINIKFKKSGYVNITLGKNSQVLANDGFGTNILNQKIDAGYNIVDNKTIVYAPDEEEIVDKKTSEIIEVKEIKELSVIMVKSSTHPDSQKWYSYQNVELNCEEESKGIQYSYILDRKSDTVPDHTQFLNCEEVGYPNLDDGVWYFHIMQNSKQGSGPVTHFKIQIDTDLPSNLRVVKAFQTENKNEWQLELIADDDNGILYYEIEFENGIKVKTHNKPKIQIENKYKNEITISAYDLSGNSTSLNYEIPTRENETFWDKIAYVFYSILDFFKNL